jgi:hypothetical protein
MGISGTKDGAFTVAALTKLGIMFRRASYSMSHIPQTFRLLQRASDAIWVAPWMRNM